MNNDTPLPCFSCQSVLTQSVVASNGVITRTYVICTVCMTTGPSQRGEDHSSAIREWNKIAHLVDAGRKATAGGPPAKPLFNPGDRVYLKRDIIRYAKAGEEGTVVEVLPVECYPILVRVDGRSKHDRLVLNADELALIRE